MRRARARASSRSTRTTRQRQSPAAVPQGRARGPPDGVARARRDRAARVVTVSVKLNVPLLIPGVKIAVRGRHDRGHGARGRRADQRPPERRPGTALMLRRLISEERGQASTELLGMLWWMLLCALAVWQLLLAAWAVDQAANAARTASRVEARGGDSEKAAHWAVSNGPAQRARGRRQRRDRQGERADPDRPARPGRRSPARPPALRHWPIRRERDHRGASSTLKSQRIRGLR